MSTNPLHLLVTDSLGRRTVSVDVRGLRLTDFPSKLRDWDPDANAGVDPTTLSAGSNQVAHWRCHRCGHRWRAQVGQRTKRLTRCQRCHTERADGRNSFAAVHPDLVPEWDRVANVPLDLLFLPLARGEAERVSFQFVLCRGGPRVYDAVAEVVKVTDAGPAGREHVVEVRYQIDFGPMLTKLVAPFLPTLSVWLDAARPIPWLGHRVPLFSKGPTVVVTRTGFDPTLLGVGR